MILKKKLLSHFMAKPILGVYIVLNIDYVEV